MSARAGLKRFLAIDWDARNLRVVDAVLSKRGIHIDRMISARIPADVESVDPESMGAYIRRLLDQEGITARHSVVDIPRDQAILKTLSMPTLDTDDLVGIVHIQFAKELPFAIDEAAIDFARSDAVGDARSIDVLVAAVRHEVVAQYAATFAAAGLKLDRIGLRPYANKLAVSKLLELALPQRVLFIDVSPTLTEIDILRDGTLAFSRAASVSVPEGITEQPSLTIGRDSSLSLVIDDGDEAAEPESDSPPVDSETVEESGGGVDEFVSAGGVGGVVNTLMMEVTRSIEAYRALDPGASIDHVVIGGESGIEEALAEAIQDRLSVATELYNPAATLGWEPDEGASAVGFAATLGLVVGQSEPDTLQLDFLHPKKEGAARHERLRKLPAVAAVLLLFMAAGVLGVTQYRKDERRQLVRNRLQITELNKNARENAKFLKLVQAIDRFDKDQLVWVDVLYDILTQLPSNKDVVVEKCQLDHGRRRSRSRERDEGKVVLNVKAARREALSKLIDDLTRFRRPGRTKPRFRVEPATVSYKKSGRYPLTRKLTILIRDDRGAVPTPKKRQHID